MDMKIEIDEKTRIIIDYGEEYKKFLKKKYSKQSDIDSLLTIWIKDKLKYLKDNPNATEKDLIDFINQYNEERKLR